MTIEKMRIDVFQHQHPQHQYHQQVMSMKQLIIRHQAMTTKIKDINGSIDHIGVGFAL